MKNDKKTIFGWCMYDWANSAYGTTVVAALLPNYFALAVVGEAGVSIAGQTFSATALWGYMLSASALVVFFCAPVLGAIADFSAAKKKFLIGFAYTGSLFATLLYFCTAGDVWLTLLLFVGSQVCFVAANVFYDAFLPQITTPERLDAVSSRGYAFGYVGGALQFAIALALVAISQFQELPINAGSRLQFAIALALGTMHDVIGISESMAARIGIGMAGIWWAGWTLFTVKFLKESRGGELSDGGASRPGGLSYQEAEASRPGGLSYQEVEASRPGGLSYREKGEGTGHAELRWHDYLKIGINRTLATVEKVRRFKHLTLFLIAYLVYNDGIHTVSTMATIYGTQELNLSTTVLMVTLLAVQIIAIGGALVFSRIANFIGTKRTVMLTLLLWSGVVTYAYFTRTATEFFLLGAVVGLVLGGSQALSRSFYGAMIPEEASAEFYGFYSVFSKFSATFGPLTFSFIAQVTGNARLSIISLMVFFVVGLVLLGFVDEEKAKVDRLAF